MPVLKEVSVDCVLFGFHAEQLKVLLLQMGKMPYWRLPGGSIRKVELISEAALRALKETTGIEDVFLQQFQTFGGADRYKYFTKEETARLIARAGKKMKTRESADRIVSVGYYALVDFNKVIPTIGTGFQWFEISKIPNLLFHHNDMIELALVALRKDLRYLPIAKLLPPKFTLRDMQKLYETILNRTFDRRNFHKLLMSYDFLVKLKEKRTGTANKAPHLYKIDFEKYEMDLQDGISY